MPDSGDVHSATVQYLEAQVKSTLQACSLQIPRSNMTASAFFNLRGAILHVLCDDLTGPVESMPEVTLRALTLSPIQALGPDSDFLSSAVKAVAELPGNIKLKAPQKGCITRLIQRIVMTRPQDQIEPPEPRWKGYPNDRLNKAPHFDNRKSAQARLFEDSNRLFVQDEGRSQLQHILVGYPLSGGSCEASISATTICDLETLEKALEVDSLSKAHSLFFLKQNNSWSPLLVTSDMFKRLLASYTVFPPFLEHAHAFGFRTSEDEQQLGGYRGRVYTQEGNPQTISMCGMNVKYFHNIIF